MKGRPSNRQILSEIEPKGQDWHLPLMELISTELPDF
jgi:hypothetical protein